MCQYAYIPVAMALRKKIPNPFPERSVITRLGWFLWPEKTYGVGLLRNQILGALRTGKRALRPDWISFNHARDGAMGFHMQSRELPFQTLRPFEVSVM